MTTGLYDGGNAIMATVVVGEKSDINAAVEVMIGEESLDTSAAGDFVYSLDSTNVFTAVSVTDNVVTVTCDKFSADSDIDIMVDGESCAAGAAGACAVNVMGGSHQVGLSSGIAISSDVDIDYDFMPSVTSVSPASGSKFGGVKLTLTGFNLLADSVQMGAFTRFLCEVTVDSNDGTTVVLNTCGDGSDHDDVSFAFGENLQGGIEIHRQIIIIW